MPILCAVLSIALETFTVVDSVPHDTTHFTQGLFFKDSLLVESTGLYGQSGIYRYQYEKKSNQFLNTDSLRLQPQFFGEGATALGNNIFWLTWKEHTAFAIDFKTFQIKQKFHLPTEGWGITFCNGTLFLSDGSDQIFKISPDNFQIYGSLSVHENNTPIRNINELECIDNQLYANIWQSDSIAKINLKSGAIQAYIDFSPIATKVRNIHKRAEVLNGIAYDGNYLWITGKRWPIIYKIKLNR